MERSDIKNMKLLVITQKVDMNDSNLGFFHLWLQKLSEKVDHLYIICLQAGKHELNKEKVTILSLGKESGISRFKYIRNFYTYIWKYRKEYDSVFVHMNPRYAALGKLIWWKKKVLLWYTHKKVNWELKLGSLCATKIFTASKESFRLPSKKVEIVGHGIPSIKLNYNSIQEHQSLNIEHHLELLSVGRITPAKDWETVIHAVAELENRKPKGLNTIFFLFAGTTINKEDEIYRDHLAKMYTELAKGTHAAVTFNSYPPEQMQNVYQNKHILIHTSRTGSMDKVVLEALAAGRIVISSSEAYAKLAENELKGVLFHFPPGDYKALATTIEKVYTDGILKTIPNVQGMEYVKKHHNLDNLVEKIIDYLT